MSEHNLDTRQGADHATVEYTRDFFDGLVPSSTIYIRGGHGDCEQSAMFLDAKQAIALLEWLTQERSELERLAAHQEGHEHELLQRDDCRHHRSQPIIPDV